MPMGLQCRAGFRSAQSALPLQVGIRTMLKLLHACVINLIICVVQGAAAADPIPWPSTLPVYDHIVIVVEENKDYEQILGGHDAPYLGKLAAEGASFERMFGEEHFAKATTSGCSPAAIRMSAFSMKSRALRTIAIIRSRRAT